MITDEDELQMTPNLSIEVEPDRHLVRISLGGLFSPSDVDAFVNERDRAHRHLRCAPNEHVTLVDIRAMAIQPQDSVIAFQQILSNSTARSRRLAFVITRSLACMQIKRAAASRDAAYFETVDDAERWLVGDDGRSAG